MKRIRIGNDIRVAWSLFIKDTGEPLNIQGSDISLYLKSKYGKELIDGFSVEDNVIYWTFLGGHQKYTGEYSLILVLNENEVGMLTHDACEFVTLVACSCQEGGEDECGIDTDIDINIESNIDTAITGGAISIEIDNELSETSTNPVENRTITLALDKKVDKIDGKGLSTEDFTREEKQKLFSIEENAQKNITPDWNASEGEAGYIKNRTHSAIFFKGELLDDTIHFSGIDPIYDRGTFVVELVNDRNFNVFTAGVAETIITDWAGITSVNIEYDGEIDVFITCDNPEYLPDIFTCIRCYVVNNPLHEQYLPDTIARVSSVENLENALLDEINTLQKDVQSLESTKQDKEAGKGLSTNDFTDNEKEKLSQLDLSKIKETDSELSTTSENPLMNRVVTSELGLKATKVELEGVSDSVASLSDVVTENKEASDTSIASLEESVSLLDSEKANTSGYYPELHVGLSDNLPDRGDIVEGAIGFRASAGEGNSIEDGVANVKELLGDSVVWNQILRNNRPSTVVNGITITNNGDGSYTINGTATEDAWIATESGDKKDIVSGHKWFYTGCPSGGSISTYCLWDGLGRIQDVGNGGIAVINDTFITPRILVRKDYTCTNLVFTPRLTDLTHMFGAGNEPTTIDEFNAFCNQLVGVDLNAYNEGEVIGVNANGFKSVNDNAWDEEWEKGYIHPELDKVVDGNAFASVNYIHVIPNERYHFTIEALVDAAYYYIIFYDRAKNRISAITENKYSDGLVDIPNNCEYMRFYVEGMTTYNHDICIRLAHSGYKTDYVAHKESEVSFDLSEYFPYGMHGIGEVRDSATPKKATRRFGVVDMGTLNWRYSAVSDAYPYGLFVTAIDGRQIGAKNVLVAKGTLATNGFQQDKTFLGNVSRTGFYYIDSSYTDAATFKAAMSGVMLYYELAEPIETEIDPKQNYNYEVWDFGTEEMLSDMPSMPVITRTIYGFNATDTIRGNKTKNEEQDERLTTLEGEVVREGDYSPNNTVGFADDLVGRGESVPAEFSFRASGGKSIKDGTAWIKELRGNAVVWNQMVDFQNPVANGSSSVTLENGEWVLNLVAGANNAIKFPSMFFAKGHVVRPFIEYTSDTEASAINVKLGSTYVGSQGDTLTLEYLKERITITSGTATALQGRVWLWAEESSAVVRIKSFSIYDLTKMFGSGNEPSTIEEFYSRCPLGVDMNAYNEGELIADNSTAIKSIGDNAWDEQWELGYYDANTGEKLDDTTSIRNITPIKVLPNQTYHVFTPQIIWVYEYDSDMNYLGGAFQIGSYALGYQFTTKPNCSFINFRTINAYGATYKNDITISLYHSGWKAEVDNVYKPYVDDTLTFDQRILDTFPNGRRPWDKVYNKDGKGYIVKGTGEVDLGTLAWALTSQMYFRANIPSDSIIPTSTNYDGFLCAKYERVNFNLIYGQSATIPCFGVSADNGMIGVYDSAYTDATTFKEAMQGVMLWYELAEPEIIEYDKPFNLDYKVWDFGTEQAIAEAPSAPIDANIIYQFNAVDQIRENYNAIQAILARLTAAGI